MDITCRLYECQKCGYITCLKFIDMYAYVKTRLKCIPVARFINMFVYETTLSQMIFQMQKHIEQLRIVTHRIFQVY